MLGMGSQASQAQPGFSPLKPAQPAKSGRAGETCEISWLLGSMAHLYAVMALVLFCYRASGQENPERTLQQAIALHQAGDLERAIPQYCAYLTSWARFPMPRRCSPRCIRSSRRCPADSLSPAPRAAGSRPAVWLRDKQTDRGQQMIIADFEKAAQLNPHPGALRARFQLPAVNLGAGRLDEAGAGLEAMVQLAPQFVEAHISLATVYYHLQQRAGQSREKIE